MRWSRCTRGQTCLCPLLTQIIRLPCRPTTLRSYRRSRATPTAPGWRVVSLRLREENAFGQKTVFIRRCYCGFLFGFFGSWFSSRLGWGRRFRLPWLRLGVVGAGLVGSGFVGGGAAGGGLLRCGCCGCRCGRSSVGCRVGLGPSRRVSRVLAGARVGCVVALGRCVVVGGWGLVPSPFPLSGVVAFAGSRFGSPWSPAPVALAVLAAGGSVRVGCARGVDSAVRRAAPLAVVVSASAFVGLPPRAALARRTAVVVSGAAALCLFPPASGVLGPGSSLALTIALERGLPVWSAGPRPVGLGWRACTLAGVPGWLCSPAQPSLF